MEFWGTDRLMRKTIVLAVSLAFAWASPVPAVETGELVGGLPNRPAFHPEPAHGDVSLRLELITRGLEQPIYLTSLPGRPARLFVLERTGRIRVIENGDLREEPFLDLRSEIDWAGERGLLGLAFDPDFDHTGRFYVTYSDRTTLATVVARYRVKPGSTPLVGDAASREEIIRIEQPAGRIDHKGGWIGFRPGEPNYLYIATGDGGDHNDPDNNAQNLQSRLGKILRVDVSGSGPGFAIPADNPFIDRADARPEIWAYGVRNPFRPSFDRETGDLYFGDVGQDTREEVNFEPAGTHGGRNYGWRLYEGRQRNPIDLDAEPGEITQPILDYAQADMMFLRGCVIGGYVYRGRTMPELKGTYFFADFTNARMYSLRSTPIGGVSDLTDWSPQLNPQGETLAFSGLVSFGEDADGELYVVDFAGAVFRLARR